ncbi:MAG TPA: DUF2892 domain-containing protein [Gammaproteobacteria bacterium]|nr:DUF2892 domain-containing protein [Gammaproteobacteria bacterium]
MTLRFQRNIGILDMMLRIGISAVFLYAAMGPGPLIRDSFAAGVVTALAVGNLVAALTRFCPLYMVAGINTCRTD